MMIRELFDFIVDPSITDESMDSYLEEIQQKILARGDVISQEDEIADSVFVQSFIPKTLEHVKNVEEDIDRITGGKDTGDLYYQTITGLKQALSMTQISSSEKELPPEQGNLKQEPSVEHSNSHDSETDTGTDEDDDEDEENSSDSDGSVLGLSPIKSPTHEGQAQAQMEAQMNSEILLGPNPIAQAQAQYE